MQLAVEKAIHTLLRKGSNSQRGISAGYRTWNERTVNDKQVLMTDHFPEVIADSAKDGTAKTKGAETDMRNLTRPRHISTLPVS